VATATTRKRRDYAPRVPPQQRREQLLDAALHLIVEAGHSAATMEAVAAQAGVTKPVVYGMFANRADLLAALLRREQDQAMRQLAAIPPKALAADEGNQRPDPADLLAKLLEGFLEAVKAAPERWYCIVIPMPDMPAEFHAVREEARQTILGLAEQLGSWIVDTLDAPQELDPELLAHTMVTLAEMAARLVLTDPERFHPDRFVKGVQAAVGLTRTNATHANAPKRPKQ
jgi:AcrR family transcriptional regulator